MSEKLQIIFKNIFFISKTIEIINKFIQNGCNEFEMAISLRKFILNMFSLQEEKEFLNN